MCVVNLVYIAYIHILIAIILQRTFTNYCNCVSANKILSKLHLLSCVLYNLIEFLHTHDFYNYMYKWGHNIKIKLRNQLVQILLSSNKNS